MISRVISFIQNEKSYEKIRKFLKNYKDESVLQEVCDMACDAYYNTSDTLFSDEKFDILSDELSSRNPNGKKRIGYKVREE